MTSYSGVLANKRGLIMGLANDKSIAWGIATACAKAGAKLGFTHQGGPLEKRVMPLVRSLDENAPVAVCDVGDQASLDQAIGAVASTLGGLDFVVHAIAFSDKNELTGRYVDTSRDNFRMTMDVSVYSFTAVAKAAEKYLSPGASLLTLSYYGAEKVVPNYNVMGVAKAALEASVRYLAVDLGTTGIRVNAISAGPIRTLAASGIDSFRALLRLNELNAPLRRNVDQEEVGRSAVYLLSDLASGVTGEVLHVDSGYHTIGLMVLDNAAETGAVLTQLAGGKASPVNKAAD